MNNKPINSLSRIFVLGVILFIFNSCGAPSYKVMVNGYTGGKPTIPKGRIFVYKNTEASNPLLEDEVADKIITALKMKGYVIVKREEDADYLLHFEYGITGSTHAEVDSYTSSSGGGYELNVFTGQMDQISSVTTTTVDSSMVTKYNSLLRLKLSEAKRLSEKAKPVWIGEVSTQSKRSNFRKIIDYLILGVVENFGTDTGEQKRHLYSSSSNPFKMLRTP